MLVRCILQNKANVPCQADGVYSVPCKMVAAGTCQTKPMGVAAGSQSRYAKQSQSPRGGFDDNGLGVASAPGMW